MNEHTHIGGANNPTSIDLGNNTLNTTSSMMPSTASYQLNTSTTNWQPVQGALGCASGLNSWNGGNGGLVGDSVGCGTGLYQYWPNHYHCHTYTTITSGEPPVEDGIKTPITLRLDEKVVNHLKHLARHLSYHQDKDYTHTDIIRQLVNTLFAPPHNDYAAMLQKESVLNLFNDETTDPNYVYIGPVAAKICSCGENEGCEQCPPIQDTPRERLFTIMEKHDREQVAAMSDDEKIAWKNNLLRIAVERKTRNAVISVKEELWCDMAAERMQDLLDEISEIENIQKLKSDLIESRKKPKTNAVQ